MNELPLTFTKSLFDKEQEVFYLQYIMVKGYHRLHKILYFTTFCHGIVQNFEWQTLNVTFVVLK